LVEQRSRSNDRQGASRCGAVVGEADEEEQGKSRDRRRGDTAATPHISCRGWLAASTAESRKREWGKRTKRLLPVLPGVAPSRASE
jgi:hypothetical protein